ncbi:glycosyltransferase family 4 protein [Hydrocarboniphaga sp.]|uniref:glycosyltransferase family 4 protein n=1 Tax=Hydrocarboniphaga sp. TaxID=2033016 RepID=UPI003D1469DA
MSNTRILFVTSKSLGGSGKYISVLCAALKERGFDLGLCYYALGGSQDQEIEAGVHKVYRFPAAPSIFNPLSALKNVGFLLRILKTSQYDIVHTHTSLGGFIGRVAAALSRRKLKVVHTIHAFGADEFTPNPQRWLYASIERVLDWGTDAYISPSRYIRQFGEKEKILGKGKTQVIYNSLPMSGPPPEVIDKVAARLAIRDTVNIAEGESVLLFCGRLEHQKGADVLLHAVAQLKTDKAVKLLICGDGTLMAELRSLCSGLGIDDRVLWLGWQSNLENFYRAADIFVMPSRWESFGLVFLEAMFYRLPVVSTTAQAIPEVVLDGETGLLSISEDSLALAANLKLLLEDSNRLQAMGSYGQVRASVAFGFDRFVAEHDMMYRRVTGGSALPL